MNEHSIKTYNMTNPSGEKVRIVNMNEFCKKEGLDNGLMCRVANGKRRSHKGWTAFNSKSLFDLAMTA